MNQAVSDLMNRPSLKTRVRLIEDNFTSRDGAAEALGASTLPQDVYVVLHTWLKDVLGGAPDQIKMPANPDNLYLTVSILPLITAMGGKWAEVAQPFVEAVAKKAKKGT